MIIEILQPTVTLFLADPIAQSIGLIGMLLVVVAYIHQDDTKTIKILFIANFFWGLLFFLIDAHAGLAAVFLSSLRLILSLYFKKNIKVFLFLVSLIAGFSVLTYQGPASLLPIATSFIGAYGFMFLTGLHLRISCLISSLLWLAYHISLGVIGGIVNEIMVEILLIIAIYRFGGLNIHRFHVVDTIRHLLHFPHREIDYGDYVIMADKDKISHSHTIHKKIQNLSMNIKKGILYTRTKTAHIGRYSIAYLKQKIQLKK